MKLRDLKNLVWFGLFYILLALAAGSCSDVFVISLVYVCEKAITGQSVSDTGDIFACVHDGWGNDSSSGLFTLDVRDVIFKAVACDAGTCDESTCDLVSDQRFSRGFCDARTSGHAIIMEGPTTTCGPLAVYSRELKCQLASTSRCGSNVIMDLAGVDQETQHSCFASGACPYGLCTKDGNSNVGRCFHQDLNVTMTVGNEDELRQIRETWPELSASPDSIPSTHPTTNDATTSPFTIPTNPPTPHPPTLPLKPTSSSAEPPVIGTLLKLVVSVVSGIVLVGAEVLIWDG